MEVHKFRPCAECDGANSNPLGMPPCHAFRVSDHAQYWYGVRSRYLASGNTGEGRAGGGFRVFFSPLIDLDQGDNGIEASRPTVVFRTDVPS